MEDDLKVKVKAGKKRVSVKIKVGNQIITVVISKKKIAVKVNAKTTKGRFLN